MKKSILISLTIILSQWANATIYLDETFNYADFLIANSDWTTTIVGTPVTATRTLQLPALTYAPTTLAYINSGVGNTLNNYYKGASGASFSSYKPLTIDVSVTPSKISPVYMSFLYKVQAQGGSQAQIIGMTSSGSSTSGIHVWNKGVSATTFRLGITRQSTTSADIQWYATDLDATLTYFVVVKYDGAKASLFVNPILDGTEPTAPEAFDDGTINLKTTVLSTVSHLILRGNGSNHVYFYAGGIRVSSSWAEAVASKSYKPPVSTALPSPTVGIATNLVSNGFTASWTPVENAIGYTVKVYSGDTFVDSTTVSGQATSSASVGKMIPGLTYTYKVIAKGDGTNFTNSAPSASSDAYALPTVSIPSNNLKIILKLDDLGVLNSVLQSSAALDFMVANNIKWGSGAIANRFDATAPATLAPYLNAQNSNGEKLMEIWHHGYDHSQNNPTGTWEFSGRSYADQKLSFENADQAILSLLGIQMHSFGTPYNQSDAVTNTVIGENTNYKVMMFSKIKSETKGVLYLDNRVNMESATGSPEYSYFRTNYDANKSSFADYMILQGHPNYYTLGSNNLEQFKLILQFLQSEGVTFVKPYEYYQSTSISTGIKTVESKDAIDFNFRFTNNNGTNLILNMKHSANLNCAIYSLTGSIVNPVFSGKLNTGNYSIPVDTSKLASGLYLCSLSNGITTKTVKFIVKD